MRTFSSIIKSSRLTRDWFLKLCKIIISQNFLAKQYRFQHFEIALSMKSKNSEGRVSHCPNKSIQATAAMKPTTRSNNVDRIKTTELRVTKVNGDSEHCGGLF